MEAAPNAEYKITSLIDSLSTHKKFHHLVGIAAHRLATAVTSDAANVGICLDHDLLPILLDALDECKQFEAIVIDLWTTLLTMLRYPDAPGDLTTILFDRNIVELIESTTHGPNAAAAKGCVELGLEIIQELSIVEFQNVIDSGGFRLAFDMLRQHSAHGNVLLAVLDLVQLHRSHWLSTLRHDFNIHKILDVSFANPTRPFGSICIVPFT